MTPIAQTPAEERKGLHNVPQNLNYTYYGEGGDYRYYYHTDDYYWLHIINGRFFLCKNPIFSEQDGRRCDTDTDDYNHLVAPTYQNLVRSPTHSYENVTLAMSFNKRDGFVASHIIEHNYNLDGSPRAKRQFSPIINGDTMPIFNIETPISILHFESKKTLLVVTEKGGKVLDSYIYRMTRPRDYIDFIYQGKIDEALNSFKGFTDYRRNLPDGHCVCAFDVNFSPPVLVGAFETFHENKRDEQRLLFSDKYDDLFVSAEGIAEMQGESTLFHMLRGKINQNKECTDIPPKLLTDRYINQGIPMHYHNGSLDAAFYNIEEKRGEIRNYKEELLNYYSCKKNNGDARNSKHKGADKIYKTINLQSGVPISFGLQPVPGDYHPEEVIANSDDVYQMIRERENESVPPKQRRTK